jgi:hypothetical protein
MRCQARMCALLLTVITCAQAVGQERDHCDPSQQCFLQRVQPVGGWHPYGGGLLRWWNPDCFPRCGAPDDYCKKPLPRVCWPAYPPFYIWGPPEIGHPQSNWPRDCNQPHSER